jgi:hypothetical protein
MRDYVSSDLIDYGLIVVSNGLPSFRGKFKSIYSEGSVAKEGIFGLTETRSLLVNFTFSFIVT